MKSLLLPALLFAALPVLAQTTTTAPSSTTAPSTKAPAQQPSPNSMMAQVMSVLTPAEQDQLKTARTKAMTDNPKLQTEEMSLMEKAMSMQAGTATDADKAAFTNAIQEHGTKVRAAMLKADPTIQPLLKKVEDQAAKLRAEYQSSH